MCACVLQVLVAPERLIIMTVVLFGVSLLVLGCLGIACVAGVLQLRMLHFVISGAVAAALFVAVAAFKLVRGLVFLGAYGVMMKVCSPLHANAALCFMCTGARHVLV